MGIEALITKRAELIDSAKKFLEEHSTDDGILTAEDAAEYDKIEAKIVALGKDIERRQKLDAIDSLAGSTMMREPLTGTPAANGEKPEKPGRASDEYKNDMIAALRSNFRNVTNLLQESVASDGGYLVPDEFDAEITETLNENNIMRGVSRVIKTAGEHKIPVAGADPAPAWLDEGEKMTKSDMDFGQVILDAHKLGVAIPVTEELLADSGYNIQQFVTHSIGRSLGNGEENKFLNGDGTKGPTGIFDTTNGGTLAVTAASTGVTSDDIVDLIYSLKKPYRKNAKFIMNDKMVKFIRKLKDGDGKYIWTDSLVAGEPATLLGYPVLTSEYAPENKIAFGDYYYYVIGDRGVRAISRYNEIGAFEGQVYFVGKERVDGKLTVKEAVQILTVALSTTVSGQSDSPISNATATTTAKAAAKTAAKKA